MPIVSRRGFLTGSVLGAAALGAAGTATASPQLLRRDVIETTARAVVIGSGLGGSIAASVPATRPASSGSIRPPATRPCTGLPTVTPTPSAPSVTCNNA